MGKLKLELRCMLEKIEEDEDEDEGRMAPPLWHRRFSTAVQRREACGRQGERQLSSSEQDRDRHWRLLGEGASLKLRSRSRPLIELALLAPESHRLSRLEPTGCWPTLTKSKTQETGNQ